MTKDELRARIDAMEVLCDVITAIEDVAGAELGAADDITTRFIAHATDSPVACAVRVPRSVLLIGLEAMKQHLEEQAMETA